MASSLTPVVPYDGPPQDEPKPVPQTVRASGAQSPGQDLPPRWCCCRWSSGLGQHVKKATGTTPVRRVTAWDHRNDIAGWMATEDGSKWVVFLEGALLVGLSVLDNILSYAAYFVVRAFHGKLYTIVDVHLTLLPGLDIVLLSFAALGTASFIMMLILVECWKLPLFHEIMNFRLFFSAMPCGIVCAILLFHTKRTEWVPFAAVLVILVMIFAWCIHMRVRYAHQLNTLSRISLDISWLLALASGVTIIAIYGANAFDSLSFADEQSCPYAENVKMPVHMLTVDRWYCVPWDSKRSMDISRVPVTDVPVQLSCMASFINVFGVSINPHVVSCPAGCLRASSTAEVYGCGVYTVDSPICLAAIHAGVLSDEGGQATVYGRYGAGSYERCNRNSVLSLARSVGTSSYTLPVGAVTSSGAASLPQAFHFNNLPETREYVWLKRYDTVSAEAEAVEKSEPWTRLEATVSMRMAGIELTDDKIRLGTSAFDSQSSPMMQCELRAEGLLCRGLGAAVLELDFCRPEVFKCTG